MKSSKVGKSTEQSVEHPSLQSGSQNSSHIQQLLRTEIENLRKELQDRIREIAALTARMEMAADSVRAEAKAEITAMKKRHAVELVLVGALHAAMANGPAHGVPTYDDQVRALEASESFDADWYLQTYPDVRESGIDAGMHYVRSGAFEGRNPSPGFNTMSYYMANPDVARAGWPALVHYVTFGKAEGRPLA